METIRNRLTRKRKRLFFGVLISYSFAVIAMILGAFVNIAFFTIAIITSAAGMGFTFASYFVRCPACGGNLGYALSWPMTRDFSVSEKIKFCNFCGISLDKEIETENK